MLPPIAVCPDAVVAELVVEHPGVGDFAGE
jgi:hypothetical protein